MTAQELRTIEDQYSAHNYHPLDVVLQRGEGVWVHDVDGRRYLDCLAAYSAVNQGHCHPAILRACVEQAGRLTLTSRAFRNDQLPLLCQELAELAGLQQTLLMNSGAEAVETAVKVARRWGYDVKGIPEDRAEIIVCADNFHGRTITVVSFSTADSSRQGFGPFTPGFRVIPFGDADALRAAITPNTCAFLVEPIQGEAGVILPPDGYLREVREICSRRNILWLADEVQSGLGRTGRMFACMHEDVQPDLLIVGKALSGGFYPVSAVVARDGILGVIKPGEHGSTFGGNPLGCAIARAALRVTVEEQLAERSAELGAYLLGRLQALRSPLVRALRGRGLWIGIDLFDEARPYCEALMAEGLLCKDTHATTIRLAPPLVITKDEIDWAMERLASVLCGAPRGMAVRS